MEKELFRKKSIDRISSPEELNNYLRVTTPSVWMILIGIIIFLGGLLVWSTVGQLETIIDSVATVSDGEMEVIVGGSKVELLNVNDEVRIEDLTTVVDYIETDEYGRVICKGIINLPDGKYKAEVVVESISPISFLFKNDKQ